MGWVQGDWSPGLQDTERELSGEGYEEGLNCGGWKGDWISGDVPQRWCVSLSVSNETGLPVSDVGMVGRGFLGENGWENCRLLKMGLRLKKGSDGGLQFCQKTFGEMSKWGWGHVEKAMRRI